MAETDTATNDEATWGRALPDGTQWRNDLVEGEIRAAIPNDDGSPTMKRYDPESNTWIEVQALSHPDGGDLYIQYAGGGLYVDGDGVPRLSWWRRILYRIALSGRSGTRPSPRYVERLGCDEEKVTR